MKARILSLALVLFCLFAAVACAQAEIAVTDMAGGEVKLQGPVERIVVLSASDCEILYAIGAGDMVVARGTYCNYPAEVLDLPDVESGSETNIEQILSLNPDLVIMATMAQKPEHVEALQNAGIAVFTSDAQDIAGTYEDIALLGTLTGKTREAEAVIAEMMAKFEAVQAKAEGGEKKSVYFEVSPLEWGLWAAGADTFMDEICQIAGLTNAFSDVSGWAQISEEQVLERNPDYIVTIAMFYGEGPMPDEEIASRDNWQGLKAVVDGSVILMDADQLSRPAPRLADAAELLYEATH